MELYAYAVVNYSVFAEWIIDLLLESLWLIDMPFRHAACPKCGNRLKYRRRGKADQVQCVMCERVWQKGKGRDLRPVDSRDK